MDQAELAAQDVRIVALVLVDNAGIARMKCVPVDRLTRAAERGIGWSTVWGLSCADDTFVHDPDLYSPSGDLRLRADLDAVALLPDDGWAWAPVDQVEQDGAPWPGCQRWFLRRMVERASSLGLEFRCAWELEWISGRDLDSGFEPLHAGPGYGAATFEQVGGALLDLVDAFGRAGVPVEQVHPEYANGQMEASLSPVSAITACDHAILARQLVRTILGRLGWRASFSPRVVAGSVGSGAHIHFSLTADGVAQFAGGDEHEGLRPTGAAFLAGVLEQLPALTALGAPIPLSYARLTPSHWAGAYACWGNENREAALRFEGAGGADPAGSANVEWKSVDGAANPYLVLGAIIAAGLDGVRRHAALPAPVSVDPDELDDAARAAAGISRLPTSLGEAAELLGESAILREAMGSYLHDRVLAVSRAQARSGEGLSEEALVTRYRWRF